MFILNETWLNDSVKDTELSHDNYSFFRKDSANGRGGGVMMYCKNEIVCKRRFDLESSEVNFNEMIVSEVYCSNGKMLLVTAYRSPGADD